MHKIKSGLCTSLTPFADMDTSLKHPFTCIVAGPTGCGKTTFVTRLLRFALFIIDLPPREDRLVLRSVAKDIRVYGRKYA